MVGKRDCICCGKRLGKNGKCRVRLSLLHIFVSARLFPLPIHDDCFVCEMSLDVQKVVSRTSCKRNIIKIRWFK